MNLPQPPPPSDVLMPCPWDQAAPSVNTYLANNQGLKSACSFVTCPVCGAEKGVIAQPGDEDLAAAEAEARKLWQARAPVSQGSGGDGKAAVERHRLDWCQRQPTGRMYSEADRIRYLTELLALPWGGDSDGSPVEKLARHLVAKYMDATAAAPATPAGAGRVERAAEKISELLYSKYLHVVASDEIKEATRQFAAIIHTELGAQT